MNTTTIARSDGSAYVTRGPIIELEDGSTVQQMVATEHGATERHLIVNLADDLLTPKQARILAAELLEFGRES